MLRKFYSLSLGFYALLIPITVFPIFHLSWKVFTYTSKLISHLEQQITTSVGKNKVKWKKRNTQNYHSSGKVPTNWNRLWTNNKSPPSKGLSINDLKPFYWSPSRIHLVPYLYLENHPKSKFLLLPLIHFETKFFRWG